MGELQHHGVKGQKWGVRKDDPNSTRSKIISETEARIKSDVDKYGALEASERVSTYAYEDVGKIMRSELGPNWKNAPIEKKRPYGDLESELLDRYDDFGWDYAESKKSKLAPASADGDSTIEPKKKRWWQHSATADAELMHFGRKGMRWYQRIFSKPSSASVKTARRALANKDEFDKLSTNELRDLVARVGLESSLRTTLAKNAKENQTIVSKALQSISGIAVKAATDVAKPLVTEFVKNQVSSFLKGKGPGVDEVKQEAKKVVNEVTKAAKGSDVGKSTSQLWNDIKKLSNDGNIFGVSAETARLLTEMKKK